MKKLMKCSQTMAALCFATMIMAAKPADGGSSATATPPQLSHFVLYAERSIQLGPECEIERGDIAVRSAGPASFGNQLVLGPKAEVEGRAVIFAPTVELGKGARTGELDITSLTNDGAQTGPQFPFPASSMPVMPLALVSSAAGPNVTVNRFGWQKLAPGNYGALVDNGRLELSPGAYSFSSVALGEGAVLLAWGGVQITVAAGLNAGKASVIAGSFGDDDDHKRTSLNITVAASDDASGNPAVLIGERSQIRALLAAPHGTLRFASGVNANGAFAAYSIIADQRDEFDHDAGFADSAVGQQGSQQLTGYFAVDPNPAIAPLIGPVPPDKMVQLDIGLPVKDQAGLKAFIADVSDPTSPNFRHYMTPAQFYATHSPSLADYQNLQAWAAQNGFTILSTFPNNMLLTVNATAAQVEKALYVNLLYRARPDSTPFITVDRNPSLDLTTPILHISGFNDYIAPHVANGTGACKGNANCGTYKSLDLRNAYLGAASQCQKFDGAGQVVGIVGYANFTPADIQMYFSAQIPPLTPTFFPTTAYSGGNAFTDNNSILEAALDIELVQAMAPNARILFFQSNPGITGHMDDAYHAMATASPTLTVASSSLIHGRSDNVQQALDQMAAQGTSFFTASGDFGDVGDPQANQDLDNQTLVGGTKLITNGASLLPSPTYATPYYASEKTWNQNQGSQQQDVTGGGIMDGNNKGGGNFFSNPVQGCHCWPQSLCCGSGVPIPHYQQFVSMAQNGGSTQWRNYPDVSMLAINPELVVQGQFTSAQGTSLAAPLWAGFTALVNEASQKNGGGTMGFLNPTIYDIGVTSGTANDLYAISFNDINDAGNNADGFGPGFTTVAGYDLTTGWGSPKCGLLNQLSSATPLTPNQPLSSIRFVFSTGADDLRGNGGFATGCGGTGLAAQVLLNDGSSFPVPLKQAGTSESWDPNTTTQPIDWPIPSQFVLTPSNGIKGITLTISEDYTGPCTADNWDVKSISVSLFNPPSPPNQPVCQLQLSANPGDPPLKDGNPGLVRFSENADSSGSGPTVTFLTTDAHNKCH